MAYNAFVATTKLKKRDPDSPSMAGAPKGSTVTARSKSELQQLGERMHWTPRELTMVEIGAMSSQEMLWHEVMNSENYQKAIQLPGVIAENRKNMATWDIRKKWLGQTPVTDDDKQKMAEVALAFERLYPQWIKSEANATAMWNYMLENNLDPTKLQSVVAAFENLAQTGKISLNPSAISAGHETSVSGTELTSHRNFHLLLQRQRRATAEEQQSADQWLESHPELKDRRTPPLIAKRLAQEEATSRHFQQAASASADATVVKVVDYGDQSPGCAAAARENKFPQEDSKYDR
jgi:hypothetical protein